MKRFIPYVISLVLVCCNSCECGSSTEPPPPPPPGGARQEMRDFVAQISAYAKGINANFVIIPQNGQDIVTDNSDPSETPNPAYLNAIDGIGREDLFYGYEDDNTATDPDVTNEIVAFLNIYENNGVQALVTDYVSTTSRMDDSYQRNATLNFASFAADHRELDNIPNHPARPNRENSNNINTLSDVQNFLYILNPDNTSNFANKTDYLTKLRNTNYDLFIIDAYHAGDLLSATDVQSLKTKANGGRRLVVSYMSIGEAENYRYYWLSSWNSNRPSWVREENPNFEGNFIVEYWDAGWQAIIYGNNNSYLKKILDAGFDGVYLDIIDAFEYFEN